MPNTQPTQPTAGAMRAALAAQSIIADMSRLVNETADEAAARIAFFGEDCDKIAALSRMTEKLIIVCCEQTQADVAALVMALEAIRDVPAVPFKKDQLAMAGATIEAMSEIARAVLARHAGAGKGGAL